jgi:hypothetical protein
MKRKIVFGVFVVCIAILAISAPALAKKPDPPGGGGEPLEAIWAAIQDLQAAVANLSAAILGLDGRIGVVEGWGDHSAVGYLTGETDPTVNASVKDGVDWLEIESIPPDIADGDQVGIASESDPTVLASVKDGVDWSELSGVPTDFADGVDDAGPGYGTFYHNIPPYAFQGESSSVDYQITQTYLYSTTSGQTHWHAPVNIPDGANITGLRVYSYNAENTTSSLYIDVELSACSLVGSGDVIFRRTLTVVHNYGTLPGYAPSWKNTFTDHICAPGSTCGSTGPFGAIVDNNTYFYGVDVTLSSGGSSQKLGLVKITYEINAP